MQSIGWYIQRLSSMSAGEVVWRIRGKARDLTDTTLWPIRRWQTRIGSGRGGSDAEPTRGLDTPARLGSDAPAGWGSDAPAGWGLDAPVGWVSAVATDAADRTRIVADARDLLEHRFTFFDLDRVHLGDPIDWNREPKANRPAPMRLAPWVDYRDYALTGDCKFVWEPNRHQHLVVLGQAYRITGDVRFAREVVSQIDGWIDACPFGVGMNWRSPLELAIRLINWAWALGLIGDAGVFTERFAGRIRQSVYRHMWDIRRKYSRYSSANNHLIGEAAGLFVAGHTFRTIPRAERWRREARSILIREIEAQTFADGVNREQAFAYHVFVAEFFVLAGLVARWMGDDFPSSYWERIEGMIAFMSAMLEGGPPVMYGDADDGCVLALEPRCRAAEALVAVGAVLFDRPDFVHAGAPTARLASLLGEGGVRRYGTLARSNGLVTAGAPKPTGQDLAGRSRRRTSDVAAGGADAGDERAAAGDAAPRLRSLAFPDAGYYLLQAGRRGGSDRISVLADCGPLGFGSIAAHGHADALSVTLRVGGRDVLVDPGTYDYFTHPAWRAYFRSTRAHNTVIIDGVDQSEMTGPFLWGARAGARCVNWEVAPGRTRLVMEHDGYGRLCPPVTHRRSVSLNEPRPSGGGHGVFAPEIAGIVEVVDELTGAGRHEAEVYWHLSEPCEIVESLDNGVLVEAGGASAKITFNPELKFTIHHGQTDPILGWVSRGYHRKVACTTVRAPCVFEESVTLTTRFEIRTGAPGARGSDREEYRTCGTPGG